MGSEIEEKTEVIERDKKMIKLFESHDKPYTTTQLGKEWIILPRVFSPHYSYDSEFFVTHLPDVKQKSFLDMGCGSGIIAIEASLRGAQKVVATDINSIAVENTRLNSNKHCPGKIDVREGDLFEAIHAQEKFDYIFFNIPFVYRSVETKSMIEKSMWDYKYETQKAFLEQAKNFLTQKGKILLGFASIGHTELLEQNVKIYGYTMEECARGTITNKIDGTFSVILYLLTFSGDK